MKKTGGSARVEIEAAANAIALPIITGLGYELVDIEYARQDGELCLTVYIDRLDGEVVSLNDCETVSRKVEDPIDGIPSLTEAYILEVSSPGLDRPLKTDRDFEKYRDRLVDVKLFEAVDGGKTHRGVLKGLIEGSVAILDEKGAEHRFPRDKVAQVKRTIEF